MKFWRSLFELMAWDYYDKWSDRQRHLKYVCCKQIKETKDIQKILKKRNNDVMMLYKKIMK